MKKERVNSLQMIGIIIFFVGGIYYRALSYGFISYDDLALLLGNPDRFIWGSWKSLLWAFTNFTLQDWQPVTWISLLLDYQLFRFDPVAYHRTNIILYALSCVLIFFILKKVTERKWLAFITALLFTIHPLHVESVVWISQRKEMLSSVFWLLTMWSYVEYTKRPFSRTCLRLKMFWYVVTLAFFALGLMSKPTLVTLPIVLLLFDYWPFGRKKWVECLVEKIPFFLFIAGSCYMTLQAVSSGDTGSVRSFEELSLTHRFNNSIVSYGLYLWKTVFPYPLYFLYSQKESFSLIQIILSSFVLLGITVFSLFGIKKRPYVFVGWFWFLIVLVPMIGFIQVGSQSMADRYAYFPHIGLLMGFVWGVGGFIEMHGRVSVRSKRIFLAMIAIIILSYTFLSWNQVGKWKTSETLYQHTLKYDPNNFFIREALCEEYSYQKRYEEAIQHCELAVQIDPEHAKVFQTLGRSYFEQEQYSKARSSFRRFLDLVVDLRLKKDERFEAKKKSILEDFNKRYNRIIERPDDAHGFYLVGNFWAQTKDYLLSIDAYRHALKLTTNDPAIRVNLANVYFLMGEMSKASDQFVEALRIDPKNINAHFNFALFLNMKGENDKARKHYQTILQLDPDHEGAKKQLKRM